MLIYSFMLYFRVWKRGVSDNSKVENRFLDYWLIAFGAILIRRRRLDPFSALFIVEASVIPNRPLMVA
jgi:hypothetical protein